MNDPRESMRRNARVGNALVLILVCGCGGWAATTSIAGAVIAAGALVVESNVKKVQHPAGGVVGEILVRNGDRVKVGDVLIRLNRTLANANLEIVTKGLNELLARKARLDAERDGAEDIRFPPELTEGQATDSERAATAGERKLFEIRRQARLGQKAQLTGRIQQMMQEINGHQAHEKAKSQEIALIQKELKGARSLWEQKLMPITKLTTLEREGARLAGERGQIISAMAQVRGKIAETELAIVQIERDLGSEVGKDLRETDAKIGELVERKIAAEDQLQRIDLTAPQDGTVHESTAHTVGGVVAAGEAIMLIVPDAEALLVEARVAPQDIDQLRASQDAVVRFSAFSQRTTPEINGAVTRVSADAVVDPRSFESYYTVRVEFAPEEIARLGDVKLVPGMPVEVFIKTEDRTVLTYLVKPLRDQLARAFRED